MLFRSKEANGKIMSQNLPDEEVFRQMLPFILLYDGSHSLA